MRLSDLENFDPITIQCHDAPDADALGSGYGLYCYFRSKGKHVRLIYSGREPIQKANLRLLVERLHLPAEYIAPAARTTMRFDGLLITTDCQYGAGNVTRFEADEVAIIDHHQQEIHNVPYTLIDSQLGSCSTLVWLLLQEAGYRVTDEEGLGTALYYGLFADTNQFSELYNPLDMRLRDEAPHDRDLIDELRYHSISLRELEIAGIALMRVNYNEIHRFAVLKCEPCDPNILGLISDFLLQVDAIDFCVVFNEVGDGFKFSVRSCVKRVNASELASFLAAGIGSGGGHSNKAGGFISIVSYEKKYPTLHSATYFSNRMVAFFESYDRKEDRQQ